MASRKISHLYDLALAPIGLKGTQFSLLAELGRRDGNPPTMKELAGAMTMDRSTLGQNMQPLQRDGFVNLWNDAKDGRSRRVELTEKGTAALGAGLRLWNDVQKDIERAVGETQSEVLRGMLLSIIANENLIP